MGQYFALGGTPHIYRPVRLSHDLELLPVKSSFHWDRFVERAQLAAGMAGVVRGAGPSVSMSLHVGRNAAAKDQDLTAEQIAHAALVALILAGAYRVYSPFVSSVPFSEDAIERGKAGQIEVHSWRPSGALVRSEDFDSSATWGDTLKAAGRLVGRLVDLYATDPSIVLVAETLEHSRYMFLDRFALACVWTGIEQLLNPTHEEADTGLRIALVGANFLEKSIEARRVEFREIQGLYRLRSLVVHGNLAKIDPTDLRRAVVDSTHLLTRLLRKAAEDRRGVTDSGLASIVYPD